MRRRRSALALPLLAVLAAVGCMSPQGGTVDEKRSYVRKMRNDTLREVYDRNPGLKQTVRGAAGYAVFSNLSVKIFVLGPGQGYGMLVDNANGQETFMRMAQLGGGVGLGAKTYRALFVFRDAQTMAAFRDSGWQFGGEADVAAKAGSVGGAAVTQGRVAEGGAAVGGSGSLAGGGSEAGAGAGMEVYQITDTGISLTATIAGTRYWKDQRLE